MFFKYFKKNHKWQVKFHLEEAGKVVFPLLQNILQESNILNLIGQRKINLCKTRNYIYNLVLESFTLHQD